MALSLCVISFSLGLVAIDMFCDHYSLISSSLTTYQLDTCTSYYVNSYRQPWYTSLVTLIPMLLGAYAMFRHFRRSIYDILSIPLFLGVAAVFLLKIKASLESLATDNQASNSIKQEYLKDIAYNHVIIAVLLFLLLILQALADRTVKTSPKKRQ